VFKGRSCRTNFPDTSSATKTVHPPLTRLEVEFGWPRLRNQSVVAEFGNRSGAQSGEDGASKSFALPFGMRTCRPHLPDVADLTSFAAALATLADVPAACELGGQGMTADVELLRREKTCRAVTPTARLPRRL
jgi:hypothetical protein